MSKRIMIVAGEASGDLHGANLVKEALRLDPALSFLGIGGPRMREAGVETLVDSSQMAVVGLIEVIAHFYVICRAYLALKKIIIKFLLVNIKKTLESVAWAGVI